MPASALLSLYSSTFLRYAYYARSSFETTGPPKRPADDSQLGFDALAAEARSPQFTTERPLRTRAGPTTFYRRIVDRRTHSKERGTLVVKSRDTAQHSTTPTMGDDVLHTAPASANDRVSKPNGGSFSGPSGAAAAGLNPRSCVTCRRRKVKCDKKQPCSNCARAKIECIFPGPGRAPRKSRKLPDGELMERLRRLEGVVQSLNAQVEEHEQADAEREKNGGGCPLGTAGEEQGGCPSGRDQQGASVVVDNSVEGLETRFGRLVVDQGRSRYINNSFWASLNNEVSCAQEM